METGGARAKGEDGGAAVGADARVIAHRGQKSKVPRVRDAKKGRKPKASFVRTLVLERWERVGANFASGG